MEVKRITRIVVLCCFFVNITALFLTYHAMAVYPCHEEANICIIEMNPITDHIIQSGGFPASITFSLIFWIFVFIFYEFWLIKRFHANNPKFTIAIPSALLIFLVIDLINDIIVHATMPLLL